MSTRRTFFALGLGSAALTGSPVQTERNGQREPKLALEDYQPRSALAVPQTRVSRAKFPVIDVHTHVSNIFGRDSRAPEPSGPSAQASRQLDQIVRWMDELNIRMMVNQTGRTLEPLKRNIAVLEGPYKGRFLNCVEPSWDRVPEPGYPKWQADQLARAKGAGAVGVKVLKTLGLYLREQGDRGPLIKVDDARFDPMWDAAGRLGLPVFIHTSDPVAFFQPIDRFNEHYEELKNHPDWSFHGQDFPPKAALLEARNRVIARHRKTVFVGLHVANYPENLDDVSAWLRKYPNLHCEIGARLGELGRQPRRSRRFFDEFPDRILFGTDATPNGKHVPQQDLVPEMFQCYFRYLETGDEYFDYAPAPVPPSGRWKAYGIGLPDPILKQVYHNNAARLLGLNAI